MSTAAGIFLGAQVPASWSLDFTLPLTFIALVVPVLRDRAGVGVALVAGAGAVLFAALPFKSGLLLATAVGILAGLLMERLWPPMPLPVAPSTTVSQADQPSSPAGEVPPSWGTLP